VQRLRYFLNFEELLIAKSALVKLRLIIYIITQRAYLFPDDQEAKQPCRPDPLE
jgi:hypothetical protein